MLQAAWFRLVSASALAGAFLPSLLQAQDERPIRTVEVRVSVVAKIPRGDLTRAETEVSRIFAGAGVKVTWPGGDVAGDSSMVTDFSPVNSTSSGCRTSRRTGEMRVLLLPHVPRGLNAMGFSLPCAERGADSVVYIDKVEEITSKMFVSFSKVLGHAMAHELGHVLMRSSEHSAEGLMRANWDRMMWQRATFGAISLDGTQAAKVRDLLGRNGEEGRLLAIGKAGLTPIRER